MPAVRIGTRASALARTQTGHVADALVALGCPAVETVHVRTEGDVSTAPLSSLGGTGVFVTALRDALLDGRCDVAVHSFKDLPTAAAPVLRIAAVPVREDTRDVLCASGGRTLADLPAGARVGTGSPRRAAQLRAARPDLEVVDLRGNVDTRLGRVTSGDLDAVVLARAGLARLGRLEAVTQTFGPDLMVPAAAQGALAVEVRADEADPALLAALAALDHRTSRLEVLAERAVLAQLEAGCAAPVGATAWIDEGRSPEGGTGPVLHLRAAVVAVDGRRAVHREASAPLPAPAADPSAATDHPDDAAVAATLGAGLAEALLDAGAADVADLRAAR
ncbi:hydroxymethylbilane synthase [Cellulomonas marina]|uniref:Porphobilinogen deaminase n=1 Tax=Cellulomonas marina TaxID=988821 RepID=A0A1I0YI06_9CELL|nr:hydroxymethylbilane synthase [Cellulomonas marina]GIG28715.1 porphobilinogen deaminase [Cellulomonas marina]SFB11998.1 hydroxymethylbilane synthase [Cellulomonas marina]